MTNVFIIRIDSPIGRIEVVGDDDAVTSLSIEREGLLPHDGEPERTNAVLDRARAELVEYFAGERTDFDLPVRLVGTPFQQAVWAQLERLNWGEATSYGALAAAVGKPGSARAIGGAVGANPVPIIVGCHRVLASDGRITGYSGGEGIPTKLWLLGHEQIGFAA
jgi:methylated-DNA-[protein]-cysteine S-methyltransferase